MMSPLPYIAGLDNVVIRLVEVFRVIDVGDILVTVGLRVDRLVRDLAVMTVVWEREREREREGGKGEGFLRTRERASTRPVSQFIYVWKRWQLRRTIQSPVCQASADCRCPRHVEPRRRNPGDRERGSDGWE